MRSTLFQHGLDLVFLAEILLAHVVNLETAGRRQLFGIGLDGIGQRFGELSEIEDPDIAFRQVCRHSIGVTEDRQSPLHDHPVIARQHASDLLGVTLRQQHDAHKSP